MARSAISSSGVKIDNIDAGKHPLVVRFMKGIFNLRPTKAKYETIWDVDQVLNMLDKLKPNSELSLKMLTLKLVMLIAIIHAARVQTLHQLSIQNIRKEKTSYVVQIDSLLKQTRPGMNVKPLKMEKYPPNANLCVFKTLEEYLCRTQHLRNEEDRLFISYTKPHTKVSRATISRWIKQVMQLSGVDITKYKAHSVRPASVSKAYTRCLPVDQVLKTAGWSLESTFTKFYNKEIVKECYASVVLS